MPERTSNTRACDDLIQHYEKLLKQNFALYHDYIKQQEVLRLELLGTSTDYKYLRTWLDIAYEDILTSKSKHGNLIQHYEMLLKNNIVAKFLSYANDHETLQLKFIETMHQCNDIRTNLDASNKYIKSLKSEYTCRHKNDFSKRTKTLNLKLVENINECESVKKSLDAAHENIMKLNSEHDGLTQRFRVLFGKNVVQEFLEYAKYQEKLQQKCIEKRNPNAYSESCLDHASEEIASLSSELIEIYEMLNRERLLIEKIDKERGSLDYLSQELCCLLFKYQRVAALNDKKQQCSMINEAMQKSANTDKTFASNASNKFDSSYISEVKIEKDYDCYNFETNNERTMIKDEKPDLNNLVSTELELSFSEEDDHSNLTNNNESSTKIPPNTYKKGALLHRDVILTLDNSKSPESAEISHASQISILEFLDEHSNDRIPDYEEETMTTSNTNEIVSGGFVHELRRKKIPNLRCEIFRRDSCSNIREIEGDNCIACERLKLFKCNECNQMFSRRDALQYHVSQVHELIENYYDCAYCDERYNMNQKASLEFHIFTKHSEKFNKPYKCTICKASFVKRYLLNLHIAENHDFVKTSGQSRKLLEPYKLKQHSVVHIPGELLKCSTCGQRFRSHGDRKNHEEMIHSPRIPLLYCAHCNENYRSKYRLSVHIHKRHFGNKSFGRKAILKKRLPIHSSEKPLQCAICDCKFAHNAMEKKKRHEKVVHNRELLPFGCAHCDERFYNRSGITNHVHNRHFSGFIKSFKCTMCDKAFSSRLFLNHHVKMIHPLGMLLKCSFCDKYFKQALYKKRHERFAHPPAISFYCPHCGKDFAGKEYLTRHVHRFHASEVAKKRFECTICNKTFASNSILKKHGSTHFEQNDVSFSCAHCDKVYHHKIAIARHIQETHLPRNNKKLFKCTICNKSFATKRYLDRHQVAHITEKTYKCSMCDKYFKNNEGKQLHELAIHGDHADFICAYCDKKFRRKSGVYQHIIRMHLSRKEKAVKCTICGKSFPCERYLKTHQLVHKPKTFKCYECGKGFGSSGRKRRHERTSHEGHRFNCQHCDKNFSAKTTLITHVQKHHF